MMAMLLVLAAAAADTPQPVCVRMEPAAGFEGWGKPAGDALSLGHEAALPLKPASGVDFKPALARPAKPGTFGGFFPVDVPKAGHYRIALSAGAWADLVRNGDRLKLAGHDHAPVCSGIAKIVEYDLQPGRYWLQLSESKSASIGAMIVGAD
jgi:hypothetical protein